MSEFDLPNIKNITVSGRIGSGATTLAKKIAEALGWKVLEGGVLFEKIHEELKLDESEANSRPDSFDLAYEEKIKKLLREENRFVIQSHL